MSSTDTVLDTADVPLLDQNNASLPCTFASSGLTEGGGTNDFGGYLQCSPPSTPLSVDHYVLVEVDYNNSVAESDETNNAVASHNIILAPVLIPDVNLKAAIEDCSWYYESNSVRYAWLNEPGVSNERDIRSDRP